VLAASDVRASVTGDESLRSRPMRRVVDPLRLMGATIRGRAVGDEVYLPLTIEGSPLTGVAHDLPVASAQVKSALLLAGLRASGETSVSEPVRSRDHTERMLRYLGAEVVEANNRLIVKPTSLRNDRIAIPGDLSSAAFLLVAAAIIDGSDVQIVDVGLNPTRSGILDVLAMFGARVTISDERERCGEPVGTVRVSAGDRRSVRVDGDLTVRTLDELTLVGLLGAFADGPTAVRDAAELRLKESDRISTLVDILRPMGADIRAEPDGFTVRGTGGLRSGADVDPKGDHRMAMLAAIAGLAASAGPTAVRGWDCVAVSYPGFEEDLERLTVR